MFNHFKPTPRKATGIPTRLTPAENHRACVRHGYILARQPEPEPLPLTIAEPEPLVVEENNTVLTTKSPVVLPSPEIPKTNSPECLPKQAVEANTTPVTKPRAPSRKRAVKPKSPAAPNEIYDPELEAKYNHFIGMLNRLVAIGAHNAIAVTPGYNCRGAPV